MMPRAARQPIDLVATTKHIKARVRRVIGELEAIEQQQNPIFAWSRDLFLELVIARRELEIIIEKVRRAWWP